MHRQIIRSTFVLAAVLTLLALVAGPVAARTTTFSFTFGPTDETDTSCGFLVEFSNVGKAMVRASDTRFDISNTGVATLTNPENGLYVTQEYNILFQNRNFVTDPVTGYQSSDNTAIGPSTLYAPDGTVLLRHHGPITVHFVMDPSLPYPENIISDEVTFEHGAHDDYCETLTAALGVA
jgi:hypothetical protein